MELKHWMILGFLVFINLWGLVQCAADKYKAQQKKWRVPEAQFFIIALLGGGLGVLIGMYAFRHKTKHPTFVWGIPVITALVYFGVGWLLLKLGIL